MYQRSLMSRTRKATAKIIWLVLLLTFAMTITGDAVRPELKKGSPSARLILPYYEVDTSRSDGANTFFSVRNETSQPVDIQVSYFGVDRPATPLLVVETTLAGKELRQFAVGQVQDDLLVDPDGFARGFAIIESTSNASPIQGDYFQLDRDQGFASGFRLLNGDPLSPDNDLCSLFSIRFLNGGAFDDTQINLWLDTAEVPDPEAPIGTYAVYTQEGGLVFSTNLFAAEVTSKRLASDMVSIIPTQFGVMEIQLNDLQGHVSATMSAFGLYSVGVEATCGD